MAFSGRRRAVLGSRCVVDSALELLILTVLFQVLEAVLERSIQLARPFLKRVFTLAFGRPIPRLQ